jgi:hypothetical protein
MTVISPAAAGRGSEHGQPRQCYRNKPFQSFITSSLNYFAQFEKTFAQI